MVLPAPERIPFGKESQDLDLAWVEGVFVADGWAEEGRFSISGQDGCSKEAQKRRVAEICAARGIPTKTYRKSIRVKDAEWALRMSEMGHRAFNKHLLSIDLDEATARVTLDGVMVDAGDNTCGKNRTFTTTSKKLAVQVRLLQRMFGVTCGYRYIEKHGGLGEHGIHRLGTRLPSSRTPWLLRVREIDRALFEAPCWDITTDDHRVYLAEHDVTVSQCDDLSAAFLAACGCAGIRGVSVGHAFPDRTEDGYDLSKTIAHVLCAIWDGERWWYCDPSVKGTPIGSYARAASWEYVIDVPTGETLCEKDACLLPGSRVKPTVLSGPGTYLGVSGLPPEALFSSVGDVMPDQNPSPAGPAAGSTPEVTALVAATSAAWSEYITYERDSLVVSWTRAAASYGAHRKSAADLGVPFPDPAPDVPASAVRANWTPSDDQVIAQVAGMVDVIGRALTDVLAGRRKIFPVNGDGLPDAAGTDIGIELLPSDTVKVGYPPGAAPPALSTPTVNMPALLDAKTGQAQQVGVGSAWLVGGTVIAGTVGTFSISETLKSLCEMIVTASNQARLAMLVAAQNQLVASGKPTPSEASALSNAVSDAAPSDASMTKKEEETAPWKKALLWGGLALVGLYIAYQIFQKIKSVSEEKKETKKPAALPSGKKPRALPAYTPSHKAEA
jgi:hypothetical protein